MKKIYALAAVACMALAANAQNGAPLYATGAGDFVGGTWAPATPDEFVYADGVYTLEVANLTQFKISTAKSATEGDWTEFNAAAYDCGPEGYGSEKGIARPLYANPDAQNIVCPFKGNYTIVVAGDLSTITLNTDTEPEVGPVKIYMRGDMLEGWPADPAWQLEQVEENIYKLVCSDDMAVLVGQAFKFADADWNVYNVGGDGEAMLLDVETPVWNSSNPANITLEEEWNGVVWLECFKEKDTEGKVIFSNDKDFVPEEWLVGVKDIAIDNNEAEIYYNLQGVRVANPENGLFIVVKGGQATKIVK